MSRIKNLTYKIKNIINFFYYFTSSISKNAYHCKLIGERLTPHNNEQIIIFRILGNKHHCNTSLRMLLHNEKIISTFSPKDALKLGNLAFNEIITNINAKDERIDKFQRIRKAMLNSIHDVYPAPFERSDLISDSSEDLTDFGIDHDLRQVPLDNIYPFKLVGHKSNDKLGKTIIIYTILGKKDGYLKTLKSVVADTSFLDKFHPTEAVKFGFIHAGEEFFTKNINY